MASRVITFRLPDDLVAQLGPVAADRGVTRNALVREVLEAAADGRISFLTPEEQERQRVQAVFDRIKRDRLAYRAVHR